MGILSLSLEIVDLFHQHQLADFLVKHPLKQMSENTSLRREGKQTSIVQK